MNQENNLDLKAYVNRLIEDKNLPKDLEAEVVDQIKQDLLSQVESRVNAVIISNLKEDKLEEFGKLLDKDVSDEEMQKFCSSNIPNLAELIATELLVFRDSYLA